MHLTQQLPSHPGPLIMGILNVTPNSFSDGGQYRNPEVASLHAEAMLMDGADIIDIGGEASGPNSTDVAVQEEIARVIPVIEAIKNRATPHGALPRCPEGARTWYAVPRAMFISVDTYKADVAQAALSAGAGMINDITGLRGDAHLAQVVAKADAYLVLMYAKDATARTTRVEKKYTDVIKTIMSFLEKSVAAALDAGVSREKIIIDPGMGAFISGDPKYSYEVLRRLGELTKMNLPILIGASRKSFLPGPIRERLIPTVIAHTIALQNGAKILRVHDVKEHQLLRQMFLS